MLFSTLLFAAPFISVALADAPYTDSFKAYCDGTSQGTITDAAKNYDYYCNQWFHAGTPGTYVDSATKCAKFCDLFDDCHAASWNSKDGGCHKARNAPANPHSSGVKSQGYIAVTSVKSQGQQLQQCQNDLKRFGPVEPICPGNSMKVALVKNQKFGLACKTATRTKNLIGTEDTMEKCMERCVDSSKCSYVSWRSDNKNCWLGEGMMWWGEIQESRTADSAFKMNEN